MSNPKELTFIANARLKDIVGRGLINNDNLAIIELIKNSKDAGSSQVSIDFYRSDEFPNTSEIYIVDQGKGMTLDDIRFKWLNIAYSEKKNSAPSRGGAYAGNKGIGRFSCDRLGEYLKIFTRVKGGRYVSLKVDWTKFEIDDRNKEIGHIPTIVDLITPKEFESETGLEQFENGTLLIIQKLRSHWTLDQLKSLRRELERFAIDPARSFSVSLSHWSYSDDHEINQPIDNKVFNELDFRTTSIHASIEGKTAPIKIELRHDGDYVFKASEKNPYSELANLKISLFFLNQPAKAFFKRRTGYHSISFGSIFLFLNGFRVFPYGSEGDDWLGFDRRHGQGHQRTFGTRDLVGFIEVTDKDDRFVPVSSREGLVHNQAFSELTSLTPTVNSSLDNKKLYGLVHKIARKLEKFVVDGLDWDRIDGLIEKSDEDFLAGNFKYLQDEKPILESIDSIIKIRSPEEHIDEIELNVKYLGHLANHESAQYDEFVGLLKDKFEGTSLEKLKPSEKRDLSKFISRQAKELASKKETNKQLVKKALDVTQELSVERKRRLFAEFETTADQERIIRLHHQISLVAGALLKRFRSVTTKFRSNSDKYTKDDLVKMIESGIFEVERIQNVAKMASKADFDLKTNRVNEDLIQFIEEYINNFPDIAYGWGIKVSYSNPSRLQLKRWFRPIELTILIDNIIDNAGKSGSKNLSVKIARKPGKIILSFIDDGKGLPTSIKPEDLFKKGISTTEGSGIGLSHAQKIVEDLSGSIKISNFANSGVKVQIEFEEK